MLYLLNYQIKSKAELESHIQEFLSFNLCDTDECEGCRIFYNGDQMLKQRMSVLLERHMEQNLHILFSEDICITTAESLREVDKNDVVRIINKHKGLIETTASGSSHEHQDIQEIVLVVLGQFGQCVAEDLIKLFNIRPETMRSFFKSQISDFISGMMFKKIGPLVSSVGTAQTIQYIKNALNAGIISISNGILDESREVPNMFKEFAKDVKSNLQMFGNQFRDLKTKIRGNDIPHEVQTSLSR